MIKDFETQLLLLSKSVFFQEPNLCYPSGLLDKVLKFYFSAF